MSLAGFLGNLDFINVDTQDELLITAAIESLYSGSDTARGIMDASSSSNHLPTGIVTRTENIIAGHSFEFRDPDNNGTIEHSGTIFFNIERSHNLVYIDQNGRSTLASFDRVVMHELIHAFLGLDDEPPVGDELAPGDTVSLMNVIMAEMGETSERISYDGASNGDPFPIGTDFSFGEQVDRANIRNNTVDLTDDIVTRDVLIGNDNDNTFSAAGARDFLYGFNGDDRLFGGDGNDFLDGGAHNDVLNGGNGDDSLVGGGGNDHLNGNEGADQMAGGAGHDKYFVDTVDDQVFEELNKGIDRVYTSVSWTLGDNLERMIMLGSDDLSGYGNELDNRLNGNSGDNLLVGMGGNDKIIGAAGDDELWGLTGTDELFGGSGVDTFAFVSGDGTDRIADFDVQSETIRIVGHIFEFDDLSITDSTEGAVVGYHLYGGQDFITLTGVAASDLNAGHFELFGLGG